MITIVPVHQREHHNIISFCVMYCTVCVCLLDALSQIITDTPSLCVCVCGYGCVCGCMCVSFFFYYMYSCTCIFLKCSFIFVLNIIVMTCTCTCTLIVIITLLSIFILAAQFSCLSILSLYHCCYYLHDVFIIIIIIIGFIKRESW